MNVLIVVSDPKDWSLDVHDVEIVSADARRVTLVFDEQRPLC